MSNYDKTPTYNLKVVVNETGVKPDTLRAWERRYGLPAPDRTDGGHRLYSQNDIETIKWLIERQQEGMSISRAVKLWRTILSEGQNPIVQMDDSQQEANFSIPEHTTGTALDELRDAWVQACLNFDEPRAERILSQAFALYSPITTCIELLQKGVSRIGDQWYNDEASVQQEHFASALAMRRIHSLVAAAPAPTRDGRILVGCPPQEDHTFAPLLLTLMLRYRGWEVLYLGASVPQVRFEATIQSINPHLIILTAQTLHTAGTMAELTNSILHQGIPVAFGGSVFTRLPSLQKRIHGHYLGNDFLQALSIVDNVLHGKVDEPKVAKVSAKYHDALHHYQAQQAMIEARTWEALKAQSMPYEHFVNANIHLARDIVAALTFGDMDYVEAEVKWVEKLLLNYNMPSELLRLYLQAYYHVAEEMLDAKLGAPIVDWLQNISQEVV